MTDKTASELAAERLGYGESDPHEEMLSEVEELLARDEWGEEDRAVARATLARAKALPPRELKHAPEEERATPPVTASELAGQRLTGQRESVRRRSQGWR